MRMEEVTLENLQQKMSAGLAGVGAVYGRGLSEEGIEDRVYRLHYNAGQQRTEQFAWVRDLSRHFTLVLMRSIGSTPRAALEIEVPLTQHSLMALDSHSCYHMLRAADPFSAGRRSLPITHTDT